MYNVQKHNNCINIPLSQTFRSYNMPIFFRGDVCSHTPNPKPGGPGANFYRPTSLAWVNVPPGGQDTHTFLVAQELESHCGFVFQEWDCTLCFNDED
jgi:hypothetical protein